MAQTSINLKKLEQLSQGLSSPQKCTQATSLHPITGDFSGMSLHTNPGMRQNTRLRTHAVAQKSHGINFNDLGNELALVELLQSTFRVFFGQRFDVFPYRGSTRTKRHTTTFTPHQKRKQINKAGLLKSCA
jgi:hypothetical protein